LFSIGCESDNAKNQFGVPKNPLGIVKNPFSEYERISNR
jgi:hypothetical protein